MAVVPEQRPQLLPLQMADNRLDPLWRQGREEALRCAQSALEAREEGGGGLGLIALFIGFLAVLTGRNR